jgi:hypothetical protein
LNYFVFPLKKNNIMLCVQPNPNSVVAGVI